ncbi:MAG TPA: aminotransferase class I/II-fold pyridoxal phosphate-dependent enzyme [Longimicrobium sp.]|nr:aminotransferase class I/II-fold pyridoxal phosphate-dependent enzyme [Longimicrobium sp.]
MSGTPRPSARGSSLGEFRLAELMMEARRRRAIDMALGVPEHAPAPGAREAAMAAIEAEDHQYADPRGTQTLRRAVAEHASVWLGVEADPETEVTVTGGATEGLFSALYALIDPGDEVIVFEPFYENHVSTIRLAGGVPRFVRMRGRDWAFDPAELEAAFGPRTRAVLVSSPSNPTGKVFTREEMEQVGALCERWNAICVSDEIYEHIVFSGARHLSPIQLESLRPRSVVISGLSKTYRLSGWRLGHVIAPPELTAALRKVHAVVTGGAVGPLQSAGAVALRLGARYYEAMAADFEARHARTRAMMERAGFDVRPARGGFFFLADVSGFGLADDVAVCRFVLEESNVLVAPGSTFFADPADGRQFVRVCFGKGDATLDAAEAALGAMSSRWAVHASSGA